MGIPDKRTTESRKTMYDITHASNAANRCRGRMDSHFAQATGTSRIRGRRPCLSAVDIGRRSPPVRSNHGSHLQRHKHFVSQHRLRHCAGLAFVMLVERGGAPQAIGAWVKELGWTPAAQIIFIVLGLAPLLESMTGFGVSLIATVPLLIGLFTRQ